MPIPIDSFMTEEQIATQKLAHEMAENKIRHNCKVPVENRLGPENYGITKIHSHLRGGDGLINAAARNTR